MIATRLGVAAGLAAVLGLERELRGQLAGFRTHILVSLGACLFTLAGAYGFDSGTPDNRADVTRVASQIVTGIGFLGAGAIVHYGASVRGLTTAANLWVAAAIGLASGVGMFASAAMTTVIAIVVLSGLKPVERYIRHKRGRKPLSINEEADVSESSGHRYQYDDEDDESTSTRTQ